MTKYFTNSREFRKHFDRLNQKIRKAALKHKKRQIGEILPETRNASTPTFMKCEH